MTSLQSLVNATAFPQNLALLMATISDGDTKQFYVITLCLLLIAISLQAVLAVMTVLLPSTSSSNTSPRNTKQKIALLSQRFVIVLLIMVNFVADAFFIAQRRTTPESSATSNGSTSMT